MDEDKYNYDNIDWEQRRYEIAKEMMPFCAEAHDFKMKAYAAGVAVEYADALIKIIKNRKS